MKIKIYVVDLEIPPRVKAVLVRLGVVIGIVFGVAIAYAAVPHNFADNTVLTAKDLNENFAAVDKRVAAHYFTNVAQQFSSTATQWSTVNFGSKDYDTSNAVTTGNWHFTVPPGLGGRYRIDAHVYVMSSDGNGHMLGSLRIRKVTSQAPTQTSSVESNSANSYAPWGSTVDVSVSGVTSLAPGDAISVEFLLRGANAQGNDITAILSDSTPDSFNNVIVERMGD